MSFWIMQIWEKLFKRKPNEDDLEEQKEVHPLKKKLKLNSENGLRKESESQVSEVLQPNSCNNEPVKEDCSTKDTVIEHEPKIVQRAVTETDTPEDKGIETNESENVHEPRRKTCRFVFNFPNSQTRAEIDVVDCYMNGVDQNVSKNPLTSDDLSAGSKELENDAQKLKIETCSKPEDDQLSQDEESFLMNHFKNEVEGDDNNIKILDLQDLQEEDPPWMQWRKCIADSIPQHGNETDLEELSSDTSSDGCSEIVADETVDSSSKKLSEELSENGCHQQAEKYFQMEDKLKSSNQSLMIPRRKLPPTVPTYRRRNAHS